MELVMTKKLEYAKPVYYCELKSKLELPLGSECYFHNEPNCRSCPERKDMEGQLEYNAYRESIGQPIPRRSHPLEVTN
jgi:hypothetical protein